MNKIRTLLRTILWAACVFAVGHSMYKLIWSKDVKIILEVETEDFPLPSVTICPQWFSASNGSEEEYYGNAKTLIELYEQLPSVEKFLLRAEIADQSYRYVPSPIVPLSHFPIAFSYYHLY